MSATNSCPLETSSEHTAKLDQAATQQPSMMSQLFASLFTPGWTSGLLIFVCLFLPSYSGCNGQTIHMYKVFAPETLSPESIYMVFVLTWPYLFGLLVSVGTVALLWTRRTSTAKNLWWCYSILVVTYSTLLVIAAGASYRPDNEPTQLDYETLFFFLIWVGIPIALLSLIPLTAWRCRNWFNAAMWMQLALATAAAFCFSYVIPALVLAGQFLIGGKLALACSVFLIPLTLVQRLDGERVLTRKRHDSRLKLSLRSIVLLMHVGGLACAWVGGYLLIDLLEGS